MFPNYWNNKGADQIDDADLELNTTRFFTVLEGWNNVTVWNYNSSTTLTISGKLPTLQNMPSGTSQNPVLPPIPE